MLQFQLVWSALQILIMSEHLKSCL